MTMADKSPPAVSVLFIIISSSRDNDPTASYYYTSAHTCYRIRSLFITMQHVAELLVPPPTTQYIFVPGIIVPWWDIMGEINKIAVHKWNYISGLCGI